MECSGLRVPRLGWVTSESKCTSPPPKPVTSGTGRGEAGSAPGPAGLGQRVEHAGGAPSWAGGLQNRYLRHLLIPRLVWAGWPAPRCPPASTEAFPPVTLSFSQTCSHADSPASLSSCPAGLGWLCPHLREVPPAL